MFGTGATGAVVVDGVGASVVTPVPLPTSPRPVPGAAVVVEPNDLDVTSVDTVVVTAAAGVVVPDPSEEPDVEGGPVVEGGPAVEGEEVVDADMSEADVTDVSNGAAVELVG